MKAKLEVGTWVRFMRGGLLVVDVIEYVQEPKHYWEGAAVYITLGGGAVCAVDVLEARTAKGAVVLP